MHFAIVTYTFPPSNEIGGRRWAKFSQNLSKFGHQVTVICAQNSGNKEFFNKEFPNIEFVFLPKSYPDWLNGINLNFFQKIKYFFTTKILSLSTKKNLFDKGFAWENQLLNALTTIHNQKPIEILVSTGGPFSLLYYATKFKKRHQDIKLISDFRDPWTWGGLYGIPRMNKKQKEYQLFCEKETITNSDLVCLPTLSMLDFLIQKYPTQTTKFYLLPHAYDPNKFSFNQENVSRKGFIYGGTIYDGLEPIFKKLELIINKDKESNFNWEIYTNTYYPLFDNNFAQGKIKKNSFVTEQELFNKIKSSAAYLVFFPEIEKDIISTKFFEIIYTQTPIIYIGEEGAVGQFVRENRVGVHILPENIEKELPKYFNQPVPFEVGYFDVSKFSFPRVTQDFLDKINTL